MPIPRFAKHHEVKEIRVKYFCMQRAKKVVSDSPGLEDFAIGLVIFVINLPNGQVLFWGGGNSNYRRIVINPANQKGFGG